MTTVHTQPLTAQNRPALPYSRLYCYSPEVSANALDLLLTRAAQGHPMGLPREHHFHEYRDECTGTQGCILLTDGDTK